MIPYGRQNIIQADIDAVINVLKSDWLTQGPVIPEFERVVADKVMSAYAVAVNSATSALHLACLALELGVGDWLWTSPNTFVASANCALYCGAQVDFVDIDPLTYNLSVCSLRTKLEQAEKLGRLPKIVVAVHFSGQSCEMDEISALSEKYGFKIIEDASHAIGARYQDQPVGNCKYSAITVFSFHPVKVITTGEGGVAVTNDANIADKMQRLRSHGITRNFEQMTNPIHGPWYYEQMDLGFNYRMTDFQAALGLSQLTRLDEFIMQRKKIAAVYDDKLANLPLITPFQHQDTASAYHLYVVQVDKYARTDRNILFNKLRTAGIGVNVHYIPVHTQPHYQKMNFKEGQFVEAERYYANAISLPIFPMLDEKDQRYVIASLTECLI